MQRMIRRISGVEEFRQDLAHLSEVSIYWTSWSHVKGPLSGHSTLR